MKIPTDRIKELREQSGAGIMECRNALIEAEGELEKAAEYLRKRGKERAAKRADRATGEGVVASYIHANQKIGSLVEVYCETDFVAKNSEFQELAYDLAMQVAATAPSYVSLEKADEKEKREYEHMVREELALESKPVEIIEKIVGGKVKKHFEEISLLSQPFVKNPDMTVDDLLKEKIAKIGENIRIGKFVRFEI